MGFKFTPRHLARLGALSAAIVLALALALTTVFGADTSQSEESPYPPPIVPLEIEDPVVVVGMTANPGHNSVTFTIRFEQVAWLLRFNNQQFEIWAPIPEGSTVIESWASARGHNPATVRDGRVSWYLRNPSFQFSLSDMRSVSAPYVFTVTWDGKTPLSSKAYVHTSSGGGTSNRLNDLGWVDENGQRHWEWSTERIGVGDPALPTASSPRLRLRALEARLADLEKQVMELRMELQKNRE